MVSSVVGIINNDTEVLIPPHQCQRGALTDGFGWFIQVVLATLAFMCLILKRFCEPARERRPWIVWFYDTSKQGLGALVIHFANVFLAGMFQGDPCTWYIVSFLLDSSVGLFLIYVGIRTCQYLARKWNWDVLNFGEYGKPPQFSAWIGQCSLYILLMVIEKILITMLIQLDIWEKVRLFILPPTDPKLELTIVMLIIPFIVNVIMFWVVDNFLMRKRKKVDLEECVQGRSKIRYKKTDKKEECESEILLNLDDDEINGSEKSLQQRHLMLTAVT